MRTTRAGGPGRRKAIGIAAGSAALAFGGVACGAREPTTSPPPPAADCSGTGPATPTRVRGVQTAQFRLTTTDEGTVVDARDASWQAAGNWPVHLAGGPGLCWRGGSIDGGFGDAETWDRLHHTGGLSLFSPDGTVDGVRIHNYGDGIRVVGAKSAGFTVRRARLTYIRDDCVENDGLHSGVLVDSLLDGCYVALSARPNPGDRTSRGEGDVWRVENNLIRLQPMPTVYRGPAPGHGGFFKWDTRSPKLALHGNVFRADQDSNHTTMGIPQGALASCSGNTMVWLGPGDYPAPLPACVTVTTDAAVWTRAVAAWEAAHGGG